MKYYDMITIPNLGKKAVFESIKNAEDIVFEKKYKQRQMSLDFYYNNDTDIYIKNFLEMMTFNF